jgi:hypothetical protein
MSARLNNSSDGEQILIRTQNSEYRFSMIDPVERRGTLSGGSLGNQKRDAVLIGTIADNNRISGDVLELETGRRALFFLQARHGVERLITSEITGITRNRPFDNERRAA